MAMLDRFCQLTDIVHVTNFYIVLYYIIFEITHLLSIVPK